MVADFGHCRKLDNARTRQSERTNATRFSYRFVALARYFCRVLSLSRRCNENATMAEISHHN